MGKPIAIPRILGIDWWWLSMLALLEGYTRYALHVPLWIPSLSGLWFLVQAGWLRMAEPKSVALYFYLAEDVGSFVVDWWSLHHGNHPWLSGLSFLFVFLGIAGLFVFRAEMVRHFTETDPRGIELSGVMTFFFSSLYFQYWFYQIYTEQNAADLRVV